MRLLGLKVAGRHVLPDTAYGIFTATASRPTVSARCTRVIRVAQRFLGQRYELVTPVIINQLLLGATVT